MSDLKSDLAALRLEREPESSGSARRAIGWIVVLVLLAAAGFGGWKWLTREQPIEVQVATVTERAAGAQAAVLNASGYVTARRRATVSSKITGKVVEVNVEEGMAVKEGQVLARLDDSTARASLALAEAQAEAARHGVQENEAHLSQAKVTLGRETQLLKDGIVTQADVDQARLDVDATAARIASLTQQIKVAESQVDLQKTELDNTVVRAPFSGMAITKDAQPGEMVSPVSAGGGFTRTGICTIVDMKSLEIDVDVNESYINRVHPGQHVTAVLDAYPDWQIPAHVITTIPTADRQKATVQVRIAFDASEPDEQAAANGARPKTAASNLDPRILPDMGVKVTFLRESEGQSGAPAAAQPTTLVPKASLVNDNGNNYVFVVHGDRAERRAVRTGGADGERMEVLGGLQPGERVVVSPPREMKDGSAVLIK
jgi:RND family efflux transporter MFP subunit